MNFQKYLIITSSIIFGFFIIASIAIIFLVKDSSKKAERINQIKLEISGKNRALELLTLLESDSQKAKNYSSQLDSILITKDQLISSKRDLIAIAQANGANMNLEFRDETAPTENEPRKTNIFLSLNGLSGGFPNVANLFQALENGKYFLRLTTIDLNSESGAINGNLSGQIFSL